MDDRALKTPEARSRPAGSRLVLAAGSKRRILRCQAFLKTLDTQLRSALNGESFIASSDGFLLGGCVVFVPNVAANHAASGR